LEGVRGFPIHLPERRALRQLRAGSHLTRPNLAQALAQKQQESFQVLSGQEWWVDALVELNRKR
jgi:hypothetical protein